MKRFSACIEMLYTEAPFLERIRLAASQGFPGIEFWHWETPEKNLKEIGALVRDLGISIAAFCVNSPQGDVRGSLVNPGDRKLFLEGVKNTSQRAVELGCKNLIVLSGNDCPPLSHEYQECSLVEGLSEAAKIVEPLGVTLVLEPLNSLVDHPGYFLDSWEEGFAVVREVASPSVKLLFDVYHRQVQKGHLLPLIEKNIPLVGHFHIADFPGRHEPGSGEINLKNVTDRIDALGYNGMIGLEYLPMKDSTASVAEVLAYLG